LGANILTKFLGEEQENSPFIAAASVSNPFDFVTCDTRMMKYHRYRIYSQGLMGELHQYIKNNEQIFKQIPNIDMEELKRCKTIRDFDTAAMIKMWPHRNTEEYYAAASCHLVIDKVKVPLLCINARDDPICPSEAIPAETYLKNSNLIFCVTNCGGHIAWLEGFPIFWKTSWCDRLLSSYFTNILKLNGNNVIS